MDLSENRLFVKRVIEYKEEFPKFANMSKIDLLSSHNQFGRC